ncbi:MAG: DNRLRE domain-containing protein [Planctomycetes bacterium]|nr:DNRLRE domain-containing protein [Planctomycetota bacterium]
MSIRPVVFAACLALPLAARADVVTIDASKDNSLYEFFPEKGETAHSNAKGSYLFTGETIGSSRRRALLTYDIAAAVPAGSTINSVTLNLTVSRMSSESQPITVHRVSNSWGEGSSMAIGNEGQGADATAGDATWVSRFHPGVQWATPGGDFAAAGPTFVVAGVGSYSFSHSMLAADVQAWLDGASNFGWIIVGNETAPGSSMRFGSRENVDASSRTTLTVDFSPPAPGCIGDYNQDGGIDGSDVQAFFTDWEAGLDVADVNQDGGVDGGDTQFFFEHWEAGC